MIATPKPCKTCGEPTRSEYVQWCIGWWPHTDAQGVKHEHDPNQRSEVLVCPKGHDEKTGRTWFPPCPACGWTARGGRENRA